MATVDQHSEECARLADEYEAALKAVGRARDALKRRRARERELLRRWQVLHPGQKELRRP